MSFTIVLIVVILGTSDAKGRYKSCEYEYLQKCDESFVADFQAHLDDPDMEIYCDTFQVRTK